MQRLGFGYIEAAFSLGKVVQDSTNIVLLRVVSVDRDKNTITYEKVEDIKGKHPVDVIKHNVAHAGFNPREWQNVMAWAQEGKLALMCHNGGASETCIDNYWYQAYARRGDANWWDMVHGEPFLLRSYAGKPEKMAAAVKEMLAGQEVVVPCMVDGDKNAIALRTARIQRMRASLKLQDYNAARDFAGWGGDEIRPVLDMAGFGQLSMLPRMEGASGWGVARGHLDGKDKTDLVLFSEDRVAVMANAGEGSFDELDLPGPKGLFGGARAAAVADYNGTGKGSVLLATPTGPRLLTNLGGGKLRDDSAAFPKRSYWSLTGAAWIALEGQRDRPAVLLADRYAGIRVLKNKSEGLKPPATPPAPAAGAPAAPPAAPVIGAAAFEDVSDAMGLGDKGIGAGVEVVELVTCDMDGDGRQDVLVNFADGRGIVLLQRDGRFVKGPEMTWGAESRVAVGDLDGDDKSDVIAAGPGGLRVFKNEAGKFRDVTRNTGLEGVSGTSVALLPNSGKTDVFIGCVMGSNRLFRNNGRGVFAEVTADTGLDRRIFNSRAVAALPAPKGRNMAGDLVLVNEGQASVVLLWKK
jgi:hypothetical protein